MGDVLPFLPSDAVYAEDDTPKEPTDVLAELLEESECDPAMVGYAEALAQRESGRFSVDDEVAAEWALRRLIEARIRRDEVTRMFEQFQAGLEDWFRRQTAPHDAAIALFNTHLIHYGIDWLRTRTVSAKKSLELPSGTIKTKTTKAVAVIDDPAVVLGWAEANHPELVKSETRRWVNVTDVRQVVRIFTDVEQDEPLRTVVKVVDKATGEIVPGMSVRDEHVDVTVDPLL